MGSLSTKEPLCRAQQSAWCSRMMLNDYCCHYLSRVSSHADPTTATADLTATASSTLWRAPSGVSAAVSWACPPSELALSDCMLQPVGRKTQVRGGRARWLFPSVGAGGGGVVGGTHRHPEPEEAWSSCCANGTLALQQGLPASACCVRGPGLCLEPQNVRAGEAP